MSTTLPPGSESQLGSEPQLLHSHDILCVRACNPGPYTLSGTNTWLVDAGPVSVVIDPGPDDDEHLAAINRALGGATVAVVLVTHSHPDHLPLAERLAAAHRASVRRFPELADGDVVRAGTINITAPPSGIMAVGGYRFLALDLQEWAKRLGQGALLTALPDRMSGHRLAGRAPDNSRAREALSELGLNPLMVEAFRDRSSTA